MSVKKWAQKGMIVLLVLIITAAGWSGIPLSPLNTAHAADGDTSALDLTFLPKTNDTNVDRSAPLYIQFSKEIRKIEGTQGEIRIMRLSGNGTLAEKINISDNQKVTLHSDLTAAGSGSATGNVLRIMHNTLEKDTSYYIEVDADSFETVEPEGTSPQKVQAITGNTTWVFKTIGMSAIKPATFLPAKMATNVPVNSQLQIIYNDAIRKGTGKIQIMQGANTVEEFDVSTSSRVSVSGSTLTVTPSSKFANNATYNVVIPTGALRDASDNDIAGINANEWMFTAFQSDPTALTMSSVSPANGATGIALNPELIVTFSKELDPSYSGSVTLKNSSGSVVSTKVEINSSNPRQLRIIPLSSLTSNTAYTVDIPGGVLRDKSGNLFAGLNGAASWTFRTLSPDTTAPVLKTAKMYSNTIIRLTYDKFLSSTDPYGSSFTVTVNGETRNVSTSYVSGDSVYVVLDTGVAVGQVVRISYAPGTSARKIQDLSSNPAAAFSARDVENGLDSIMSKPREGTAYYNTVSLYYPETVYISSSDTSGQFSVTADGSDVGISSISTGSNSLVTLNLSRSIQNGEVVRVSYQPGSWPVKDSRGQALAGFSGFYVRNSVDNKAPEFQSAEVSGNKLWIRYNEPLSRTNKPLKSQYSVLVDGKAIFVNDSEIEDDVVTLTLASSVSSTQNVTLSYVPGALRLTDLNGNPAGYLNLTPVTYTYGNGTILSATLQGDTVQINFRNPLQAQSALTVTQFNVQIAGATASVLSASASGSVVTLKLSNAASAGQTGTVSYTPGAVPLRDSLNTTVAAFGPLTLQQGGGNTSTPTNSRPSWLTEAGAADSGFGQALLAMSSDTATSVSAMTRNNRNTRQFNVDAAKLTQAFEYAAAVGKSAQPVVFEVPATESSAYVGFPINTLVQIASSHRTGKIGIKYGERLWMVSLSDLNLTSMLQSVGTGASTTSGSTGPYYYVQIEPVPVSGTGIMDSMLASAGAQKLANVTDVYQYAYNSVSNQRVEQNNTSQLAEQLSGNTLTNASTFTTIDPMTFLLSYVPSTFTTYNGGMIIKGQLNGNQMIVPVTHEVVYQDTNYHWASAVIKELASKWIIGTSNGSYYGPDQKITRAEFAELVAKGLGLKGNDTGAMRFRDIRGGNAASAYIGAAADAGIITGNTDGTFKPDSLITREQMAIMMVRALEYGGNTVRLQSSTTATLAKFKDNKKIQSKDSVAKAVQEGIIQGMTSTTFQPQGNATRAQAAVMLKRVLNKLGYL
ncbi:SwmB domain-containing protein [Paenibacillus hubeiensis]|uniref:SwmB domain-containing protein n=1 Tax=Paenibacillus hubeiensis TaxID=3077330 RepID=UPI0031BA6F3D